MRAAPGPAGVRTRRQLRRAGKRAHTGHSRSAGSVGSGRSAGRSRLWAVGPSALVASCSTGSAAAAAAAASKAAWLAGSIETPSGEIISAGPSTGLPAGPISGLAAGDGGGRAGAAAAASMQAEVDRSGRLSAFRSPHYRQ